jgi:hypothetical protein
MKLTNRKTAVYMEISGILATSLNTLAEKGKQYEEAVVSSNRQSVESFAYTQRKISVELEHLVLQDFCALLT